MHGDVAAETHAHEKIESLTRELARNAQDLKAINEELRSFSYSVSHDLRAPLRSIIGYSNIILEDFSEALPDEVKAHLARIVAATDKMGAQIDGLLALSRVTRHELALQPVDLGRLAVQAFEQCRASARERRVQLTVADDLRVTGDQHLLQMVVSNLVENSWKFTRHVEHAQIEVGVVDHDGEPAYFVRDNGAGFDMRYADKLFGAFQRLHAESEFEGNGMGLAAAQRAIARHHGLMWADSILDAGATFYFTVPQPSQLTDERHVASVEGGVW